jgi:hypothetical protein
MLMDTHHDHYCFVPQRVAEKLAKQGLSREEALLKLKKKFKLTHAEAMNATWWAYEKFGGVA